MSHAWRMENLLGQHAEQIAGLQSMDEVSTHLYGRQVRNSRKIGHITYPLRDSDDKSYKVD